MENNIIEVQELSHRYSSAWAINDISFHVEKLGVLGLLGSNGAGKSTTMNIMCGVLRPSKGKVMIKGVDLQTAPKEAKRLIGFLPQNAPLLPDLTVDEYLVHCSHLRLLSKDNISQAVKTVKEECGIGHIGARVIKNLSGGYKQRVGIAQAIIHAPEVVVLDEPTNGLDPNQILEVRKLIKKIGEDRCVIFSSHILSEIQATCNDVKMIERGRLVFSDSLEAFNDYIEPSSLIAIMEAMPSKEELLAVKGIRDVEILSRRKARLHFAHSGDVTEGVITASVINGWRLIEISLEKSSLDEVFAQLSK